MKNFFKLFGLTSTIVLVPHTAFGSTCTRPDWAPVCDHDVGEGRCVLSKNNSLARDACVPETAGCADIGGCFGYTPIGHWYPYKDNGVMYRCQCGCFGEETVFNIGGNAVTGREIIDAGKDYQNSDLSIQSLSEFDNTGRTEFREMNGFVSGDEKEDAFTFTTSTGKKVTLSKSHPVLVVAADGTVQAMKTSGEVKKGDFFLSDLGGAEEVSNIETAPYSGKMVNFNVKSTNPAHHIVSANGLLLGDNAWQQRLASVHARVLWRADILKEIRKAKAE